LLEPLFESDKKEKILFYISAHGEGYAREIARTFRFNLNTVQNQLQNLENNGVLNSQLKGKVRIFCFNPRYPFKDELLALLKKAMMYLPEEEVRKHHRPRVTSQQSESTAQEHTLQKRISFALSNPWEKSRLDRFMPLESVSKKKKSSRTDGLK
jgi:predicted ArsR family transcriptional regulator